MLVFPNAKINIGLNVVSKRQDGFHNIETIMYPLKYFDALEILPSENYSIVNKGIKVTSNPDDNLCTKAFKLIKKRYNIPDVKIILLKNIPFGSGLGGGSSDAAHVIKSLNNIFELDIKKDEMHDLALQIGSDCPFFLENKPVLAEEKGDRFSEIKDVLKGRYIVLANPQVAFSTAEAYNYVLPAKPESNILKAWNGDIKKWKELIKNDFESFVLDRHPRLRSVRQVLYNAGAVYVSMTGSGSSFYGIFDKPVKLDTDLMKGCTLWTNTL